MRVLLISGDYPPRLGGIAAYGAELAKSLAGRLEVAEVRVVAFGAGEEGEERLGPKLSVERHRTGHILVSGLRLILTALRLKPDVIHALTLFPEGFFAAVAARLLNRPLMISIYGTEVAAAEGSAWTRLAKKTALKWADQVLPISKATARKATERFGLKADKMRIIPPGLTALPPPRPDDPTRASLGLKKDDFVVLTITRLVARKGVDDIIQALSHLPSRVKLVVVGQGEERTRLERLSRSLGLEDRVVFTGPAPRTSPYYRLADLFVLASFEIEASGDMEGFGIVLVEAQAFGLPVIGADSGGIPEAFASGRSGLLVPPRNPRALSQAIQSLMEDEALRRRMGRAGPEVAAAKYDWARNAALFTAVYEAASKGRPWACVANIRIPSERANAVQVLNQCQALIKNGQKVELYVSHRLSQTKEVAKMTDLARVFGLTHLPRILRLPSLDTTLVADRLPAGLSLAAFYVQHLSFLAAAAAALMVRRPEVVYTREIILPLLARPLVGPRTRLLVELHTFPQTRLGRLILKLGLKKTDGAVVITHGLARRLAEAGLRPRLIVLPDGVAERFFERPAGRRELKRRLGLPQKRPLVLYAGGLYWAWKGVDTLLLAQRFLDSRAWLVVVGGSPEEKDYLGLQKRINQLGLKRVALTGFVPPVRVPDYLQAADVLVLPNSARSEISRLYTSPMKLFEYLASGRPVVASDLPSLKEVLDHGRNAFLVRPDEPVSLAAGVSLLLDEPGLGQALARGGLETARAYTWDQRARKLLGFAG